MKLSLLFLFATSIAVSATISGDISDTAVCGDDIIQADCSFEADPARRRRHRQRRAAHTRGAARKLPKEEEEPPGADGFLNSCTVTLGGTAVNVTIKDLDYALVTFDEDIKGDGVDLELFQSLVSVTNSTIAGLFKLETYEYDDPNSDKDEDTLTTLKTFSVAWSGCT